MNETWIHLTINTNAWNLCNYSLQFISQVKEKKNHWIASPLTVALIAFLFHLIDAAAPIDPKYLISYQTKQNQTCSTQLQLLQKRMHKGLNRALKLQFSSGITNF